MVIERTNLGILLKTVKPHIEIECRVEYLFLLTDTIKWELLNINKYNNYIFLVEAPETQTGHIIVMVNPHNSALDPNFKRGSFSQLLNAITENANGNNQNAREATERFRFMAEVEMGDITVFFYVEHFLRSVFIT